MRPEFGKYEEAMKAGATAQEIWRAAEVDGLDGVLRIRMIRKLFGLSVVEAKEVAAAAHGESLSKQQAELLPAIQEALRDLDNE
jgi:ribosomal protein L7/L12